MLAFLLRRVAAAIAMLLVVGTIIFSLLVIVPGDPAELLLSTGGGSATQEASYGDDYHEALGTPGPQVLLPQEWLARVADRIRQPAANLRRATLLPHCTETTLRPATGDAWTAIFARVGVTISLPKTGCCGMAGTWGHEVRNEATSARIFAQSWAGQIKDADQMILATGFSCRCQTALRAGVQIAHPITLLKTCLVPG